MKNTTEIIPKPAIEALSVRQALVGIEFDKADASILSYLNFFKSNIPVNALYFMHVLPATDWFTLMREDLSTPFQNEKHLKTEAVRFMEQQVKAQLSTDDEMYVGFDIQSGNPLTQLLERAEELNTDLLVIGQSNTKTSHNILSKNLARRTSANALVIPEDPKQSLQQILVPIDFSENAGRALEAAVSLCKRLDGVPTITCVYVYRMPSLKHFKLDAPWIQTISTVEENIRSTFEDFVFAYAPEYQDQIKFDLLEKTTASIASDLKTYAEEKDSDFMVLGAKGHSKVHLLLLGSVAEELLDINEDIPALIIK